MSVSHFLFCFIDLFLLFLLLCHYYIILPTLAFSTFLYLGRNIPSYTEQLATTFILNFLVTNSKLSTHCELLIYPLPSFLSWVVFRDSDGRNHIATSEGAPLFSMLNHQLYTNVSYLTYFHILIYRGYLSPRPPAFFKPLLFQIFKP